MRVFHWIEKLSCRLEKILSFIGCRSIELESKLCDDADKKKIRILYNISFRYFVCFPKRKISTSWEIFRFSCIHFLSTHISIMKTNFSHCYFGRISSFINVTITFLFAWTQKNHILNLNINYWNEHEYWNHVNLLIIQCTM